MGIFHIFQKKQKQEKSDAVIKIGDWVTQYSAGYWKVVDVFPKYADEDRSVEGQSWKKGERIGDWVILKKGCTPKMKPANACELVDAQWCKVVSYDVLQGIEIMFAENPKAKEKFEKAAGVPSPSVLSVWMGLSDEQAEAFSRMFSQLPERFTVEQFWLQAKEYREYIVDPSKATHILYLYSHLWEIDENFDPLHFGPEIKRL